MIDLLSELRNQEQPEKRTAALKRLYNELIVEKGLGSDATKMDFVMEDGIIIVAKAILDEHCPSSQVHQGMSISRIIANDSLFHLLGFYDAIGGLSGVLTLLENHRSDTNVLKDVLFMLYVLMKNKILSFGGEEMMKWLFLFDLILEGVDENLGHSEVFKSFCFFLTIQGSQSPPQEMLGRTIACVNRGVELHAEDENSLSIGSSLVNLLTERERKIPKGEIASKFSYGMNRCAAAA